MLFLAENLAPGLLSQNMQSLGVTKLPRDDIRCLGTNNRRNVTKMVSPYLVIPDGQQPCSVDILWLNIECGA